jgi:ABC-type transport system involved in multi-copper enzyme maturation permease subunit
MLNLMKLELKRNKIRSYLIATAISFLAVVGLTYLMAYAPQSNPGDPSLSLFGSYGNLTSMSAFICMGIFAIISAVMYSRFLIEEYSGRRAILLFSYPVSRKRILFAKLAVVSLFTVIAMTVCGLLSLVIFSATELISPMVNDTLTPGVVLGAAKSVLIMAVIAAALGIVAAGIGFIKKSVPATIVSSVIMVSVLSNIASGALTNDAFLFILMGISAAVALLVGWIFMGKVNHMEVE